MASISTANNGRRKLQFSDPNGKRRTIYLGKVTLKAAESIRAHAEQLLASKVSRQAVPPETARWLGELGDELYSKLAAAGLADPRSSSLLAAWIDSYAEQRTDLKTRTRIKFKATRDYLVEYLGENRDLRTITEHDADTWRIWLMRQKGHAENTLRKHAQIAKQFFTAAVKARLIDRNPFSGLPATVQANPLRKHFITAQQAQQVLDACPDAEWRLIFALSRYGGLRCPSEHLALTWDCVDWERSRLRVPSPKTEHHIGQGERIVPIFPELLPYLQDAWEQAPEGSQYVIRRYRDSNTNLRTNMLRIIRRAGLVPWPKLFHNLRATRQTELADQFPAHVVCAWIGNSEQVAERHYLQVTEQHFSQAVSQSTQKTTQTAAAPRCLEGTEQPLVAPKSFAVVSSHLLTPPKVAEEGLEPPTRGL